MKNKVLNKRFWGVAVILCLNTFGAITPINGQSNNVPPWYRELPPEDELWGIGTAKLANGRNPVILAELNARSLLALQIYSMDVSRDNDDEFNGLYAAFLAYIGIQISFEIINDTRTIRQWAAPDGTVWCVVAMKKRDALKNKSVVENIFQQHFNSIFHQ